MVTCPAPGRSTCPSCRTLRDNAVRVPSIFMQSFALAVARSIEVRARRLHDRAPLGNFRFDIGREIIGAAANDIDAEIPERLLHCSIVDGQGHPMMKRLASLSRSMRRRHYTVPCGRIEILDPELVNGRNVR